MKIFGFLSNARARGRSLASTNCFLGSPSANPTKGDSFQAANRRCLRSRGPCCSIPSCCYSMSHRRDWRLWSCRKSFASLCRCALKGFRCCWSNKTSAPRWRLPIGPMCSTTAASSTKGPRRSLPRMRRASERWPAPAQKNGKSPSKISPLSPRAAHVRARCQASFEPVIERDLAWAADREHQQHRSPQDVILDGDVGQRGVGNHGDDVENEQHAGCETRRQAEDQEDRHRQLGGGPEQRRYGRRQYGNVIFVREERKRYAPIVDLGQSRHEKHPRDVEPQAEQQQRLQHGDKARQRAIKRGNSAERRSGREGIHARPFRNESAARGTRRWFALRLDA